MIPIAKDLTEETGKSIRLLANSATNQAHNSQVIDYKKIKNWIDSCNKNSKK
jgi:hypothetical protein